MKHYIALSDELLVLEPRFLFHIFQPIQLLFQKSDGILHLRERVPFVTGPVQVKPSHML